MIADRRTRWRRSQNRRRSLFRLQVALLLCLLHFQVASVPVHIAVCFLPMLLLLLLCLPLIAVRGEGRRNYKAGVGNYARGGRRAFASWDATQKEEVDAAAQFPIQLRSDEQHARDCCKLYKAKCRTNRISLTSSFSLFFFDIFPCVIVCVCCLCGRLATITGRSSSSCRITLKWCNYVESIIVCSWCLNKVKY